jgi:hypothetical protein
MATRDRDEGRSEIVTLSWWTDSKAIQAFAGADISLACYFPEDDRFLLTRSERVQHYESTSPGVPVGVVMMPGRGNPSPGTIVPQERYF